MIKLKCPECDSDKIVFVSSELNEEDCFKCEECNAVYPLSEMEWDSGMELISRKAVLTTIHNYFRGLIDKGMREINVVDCNTELCKEVDNIEVAYDVDKVVEQLEECERYVYDAVSDEDNYVIDAEKAIEIVKGGG